MKKNSIEKIKDFLSFDNDVTLLVNQVNEEIYCFYSYIIKVFTNKFDVKIDNNLGSNENYISNELILLVMVGVRTIYFVADVVTGIFGFVGAFISDKYY